MASLGLLGEVLAVVELPPDGPGGPRYIVGGSFSLGGFPTNIAQVSPTNPVPADLGGTNGAVRALLRFPAPAGLGIDNDVVYVGGDFTEPGAISASRIAIWNPASGEWLAVGADSAPNGPVHALTSYSSNPGVTPEMVYIGGSFTNLATGQTALGIARLNNGVWEPVGAGNELGIGSPELPQVFAFTTYDIDGPGFITPRLIVGGSFVSTPDITTCFNIIMTNGTSFVGVVASGGVGTGFNGAVRALTTWDQDGFGAQAPVLVAGGDFTGVINPAAATPGLRLAYFDRNTSLWTELEGGVGPVTVARGTQSPAVRALAVVDDNSQDPFSAGDLFVGGTFGSVGGDLFAQNVASLSASGIWNNLNLGANARVSALLASDIDGRGRAQRGMIAGGSFDQSGGEPTAFSNGVVSWHGRDGPIGLWVAPTPSDMLDPFSYVCTQTPGVEDVLFFDAERAGLPLSTTLTPQWNQFLSVGPLVVDNARVVFDAGEPSAVLSFSTGQFGEPAISVSSTRSALSSLRLEGFGKGSSATYTAFEVIVGDQGIDEKSPPPWLDEPTLATLRLANDAQLVVDGQMIIGRDGDGAVTVSGDSALLGSSTVLLGQGSSGLLELDPDASLTCFNMDIGRTSSGTVTMGAGASIVMGVTTARDRGVPSLLRLGAFAGSSGTLTLTDPATSVSVGDAFVGEARVGEQGTGLLDLSAGDFFAPSIGVGNGTGSGTINLGQAGRLLFSDSLNIGPRGVLAGNGSLNITDRQARSGPTPQVVNSGTMRVGSSSTPSVLSMVADYVQIGALDGASADESGRLEIDLFSILGADTDRLNIVGQATLGGQLRVALAPNFVRSPGQFNDGVEVLTATEMTRRFDVAVLPGLAPDTETGAVSFLVVEYVANELPQRDRVVLREQPLAITVDPSSPQGFNTPETGVDAAVGDLNGDGLADLAIALPASSSPVAGQAGGNVIILFNGGNNAGGYWNGFTTSLQIAVGPSPSAVAIGQFDGQPGFDLAVATLGDNRVSFFLNDGAGFFTGNPADSAVVAAGPRDLAAADFNSDFIDDVAVACFDADVVSVLLVDLALRAITRTDTPTADGPISITGDDLDNDKLDDIGTANFNAGSITVLLNAGGGLFSIRQDIDVGEEPTSIASGDLDNDKDLDLSTSDSGSDTVSIAPNSTNQPTPVARRGQAPLFGLAQSVVAGDQPISITSSDLDNDKDLDVAVVVRVGGSGVVRVLRNDLTGGQIILVQDADLVPDADAQQVLSADVNGDGVRDLITINNDGSIAARGVQPVAPGDDISVFILRACPGDATGDRMVNFADLTIILTHFGTVYDPVTGPGDANGDGVVNFTDLTDALLSWMRSCE